MTNKLIFLILASVAVAAPAMAATYDLDVAHSSVTFKVYHMGFSPVPGRFKDFKGTISYDPAKPEATSVDVTIEVASIDTANPKRDGHLQSPDFFDVKKFPTITFKSKSAKVTPTGLDVTGDLTIHGVTKPVTLPVTHLVKPFMNGQDKKNHIGGLIDISVIRQDYGLNYGKGMTGAAGDAAIANEVNIEIGVDAADAGAPAKKK